LLPVNPEGFEWLNRNLGSKEGYHQPYDNFFSKLPSEVYAKPREKGDRMTEISTLHWLFEIFYLRQIWKILRSIRPIDNARIERIRALAGYRIAQLKDMRAGFHIAN
jgi:hypothetical protein